MLGLLSSLGGVGLYDIGQKIANTSFTFMTTIQNVFAPQVYKDFSQRILRLQKCWSLFEHIFIHMYSCLYACRHFFL